MKEDEDNLEGNFLERRAKNAIPAGYQNHSDESINFPVHASADRGCQPDRLRPQEVAAATYLNIPLRCQEQIIKAFILDLKHMSRVELEKVLKEKEIPC